MLLVNISLVLLDCTGQVNLYSSTIPVLHSLPVPCEDRLRVE